MKKRFRLFCIFLLSFTIFLLTSCVDYVQSISYKNGKYELYYKVTFSKVLFALCGEDPNELFSDYDEDYLEDIPEDVYLSPINTDLEVGAEFNFNIDSKTTDEDIKQFLPTVAGSKYYIPFLLDKDEDFADIIDNMDDPEFEVIAKALCSSAKCRILISKKVIPEMETAYFEGKFSQNYSIPLFDYGEQYCLEIPLIAIFETDKYRTDRVVVIKKS